MLDLQTSREVIVDEWDKFIYRLEAIRDVDWETPVRCMGWRVADLVAHVAWGISMESDALHRMKLGISEPADGVFQDPNNESQILLMAVKEARDQLASELHQLTQEDLSKSSPMPFGPTPAVFALQIFAMEAGVHGDDLADALRLSEGLSDNVITATATVLEGSLPILAQATTEKPNDDITFRISGDNVSIDVAYGGGGWHIGPVDDHPDCQITGSDSNLILFALGRIPPEDSRLKIAGKVELAMKFKLYFPGP